MRPEERTYLAHRQRNPFLGLLPWVDAHFGLRREHRALHGDGQWMRRDVIRQDQYRRLALRTKSRVTVKTKSAFVRNILVTNFSTVSVVISGRRLTSSAPQPVMLASYMTLGISGRNPTAAPAHPRRHDPAPA